MTVSNIAYTFGGYWYENDRRDIGNWKNVQAIEDAGVSSDPKRVGQVSPMRGFVFPREMNVCVACEQLFSTSILMA